MKKNYALTLLLMLVLNDAPVYAEIYKWVDSQGITHFSDTPHTGAESITIQPIQTYSPAATPKKEAPQAKDEKVFKYESVAITSPEDNATVRNNQAFMPVMVDIKPELQKGDTLQLIYDNNPVGKPQTGLSFMVKNIDRGTHTIAVQVLNSGGDVILTSDAVTFYMHQAYIQSRVK